MCRAEKTIQHRHHWSTRLTFPFVTQTSPLGMCLFNKFNLRICELFPWKWKSWILIHSGCVISPDNNNNQRASRQWQGVVSSVLAGINKQIKIIDILLRANVDVIQFKDITWFHPCWWNCPNYCLTLTFSMKFWGHFSAKVLNLWALMSIRRFTPKMRGNTEPVDHHKYYREIKQNF